VRDLRADLAAGLIRAARVAEARPTREAVTA
jgi:hypothetical protein